MKITISGAVAGALLIGTTLTSGVAQAQNANAAVVISGEGCTVIVPNAAGQLAPPVAFVADAKFHRVFRDGAWLISCHADLPETMVPPELRRAEGFLCGSPTIGLTRDSKMQATPGGRWSVSCRVNGGDTPLPVPGP